MLKKGFTLAEVLVTLGIIGVVAALTTPALIQNIGNAKIGPTLAKAVSTFTVANETMLAEEESNSITGLTTDREEYAKKLSQYMKISKIQNSDIPEYNYYDKSVGRKYPDIAGVDFNSHHVKAYSSEDNILYYISYNASKQTPHTDYANIPNNQIIGNVFIDINGLGAPNTQAKDIFRFYFYNDGSLRPYGGIGFDKSMGVDEKRGESWQENCSEKGLNGHQQIDTCAGSIFDNNMKVIYK